MEAFSGKWFTIYYTALGVLTCAAGIYLLFRPERFGDYLKHYAKSDRPPYAVRTGLKYFFLFTIPCLILSFTPFSWIELLFSLWSLLIVYVIGIQLVHWNQTRKVLLQQAKSGRISKFIRITGAIMLAVSLVMFMLGYLALNSLSLG